MGGLSKKAFLIKGLMAESGRPTLVLNGGNLLFKADRLEPAGLEAGKIAAEAIMQATIRMGGSLAGVGSTDLAAGLAFLRQSHQPPGFIWLSLNLLDPATGKPLFASMVRREVGGLKIAILAITDHEALQNQNEGFQAAPWRQTLPAALAGLRPEVDFILLLSNYGLAENQDIARTCPDLDLILQAGHAVGNMSPLLVNRTLIAQAETRGKYLGVLDIDWNGPGRWSEEHQPQGQAKGGPPSTYANRFIALKLSMSNDAEIEQLVRQTQQRIEQLPPVGR